MRLFPGVILAACFATSSRLAVLDGSTTNRSVDLVVAATTDVHGRARGWDYYKNAPDSARGLARAATIVDSLRAANPGRVVLVDAGDLLQGNPLAYVAAKVVPQLPNPMVAAMNVMRYDAVTVGNHEFNYGLPALERAAAQAHFPMLAANAFSPTGRRAFKPWVLVKRAGVRIGIVGATTPGSMIWDRENLRGHLEIKDVVPEARRAVREVRDAGAQVVIVSIHSGLDEPSSYDTVSTGVPSENVAARVAREVAGIDLIVYGHSHKEMAGIEIGSTLLVQPKNWAASVAVVHLQLDSSEGGWHVATRTSAIIPVRGHQESAAVLAATDSVHRETVAYATTPIGSTPVAWRSDSSRLADTPLLDLVAVVERQAAGTQLAAVSAFSLDARLEPGPVTVAQIAELYPYDNTLRAVRISGRQLRDYLEFSARYYRSMGVNGPIVNPDVAGYNFDVVSGVNYTMDLSRPVGQRITELQYRGRPVAPNDTFSMAVNNYRQSGGGGYAMLAGAPVIYDRQLDIRQLVIDEVRARKTLRPEDYAQHNWSIAPRAAATNVLRIIATNDFHGALEPRRDNTGAMRGGAAYVATVIAKARDECTPPSCQSILVDGGDMFQGTPASNLAHGRSVIDIFNALDYAGAALGNHEFDWGQDTLRALMGVAHYPVLGANVRYADGRDVEWIPDDTIVRRGPIRVGLIGVALPSTPRTTATRNVTGLRFDDPAPIVDSIARALRSRGANVVVVLAHAGAFCGRPGGPPASATCAGDIIDLARNLREKVDVIVSGHTHSIVNTVVNGIPIVQARSSGQAVAVVDVPVGGGGEARREIREVFTDSLSPVAAIQSMVVKDVAAVAALVNRPEARVSGDMLHTQGQQAIGNLIADAMRVEGHADVGIMNNGGIRAGLRAGDATYGTLFEVEPFANMLYRVTVRGRDLRAYLEHRVARAQPDVHVSGLTVTYDPERPAGSRVLDVRMAAGGPLADDKTYTVVINDFMATSTGDLSFGDRAIKTEDLELVDLDALAGYLHSLPQPVTPPNDARFVARAAP